MPDIIVWADIPVTDMKRAMEFYQLVTQQPVIPMPETNETVAVLGQSAEGEGPLVSADLYLGGKPGAEGVTVYLSAMGDIDGMLARVVEAGGTVAAEKKYMGPMVGWVAFVIDTEGNRLGIQQPGD
jgi:uncharacterized protein